VTRSKSSGRARTSTASSAKDAFDPLAAALTAAREGDFAAARDHAIVAWRDQRTGALADVIDTLESKAPDVVTAQLAAAITPRVVSSLPNVKALAKLDDPRVSRWAIEQLGVLPFTADSGYPLLAELVAIIRAREDSRLRDHANAIVAGILTRINRLALRTKLSLALAKVTNELPDEPEADPRVAELAKLVEPLRKATRDASALLADIYAHPTDDAPRLVYADVLTEQGDPRGEFITLQLARGADDEPSEREVQLLKKYGKAWLGALAPVASWGRGYSGTRFRRGFVAKVDIILSVGKKLLPIMTDPAWATVEELDGSWPRELLENAPLRGLVELDREVDGVQLRALAAKRRVFPALATLRLADPDIDAAMLRAVFPAVASVRVYWYHFREHARLPHLGVPRMTVTHNWCRDEAQRVVREDEIASTIARLSGTPAPADELWLLRAQQDRRSAERYARLVRGADGMLTPAPDA